MMLTESGSIKVMDFGIARVLGSARMTKQGNIIGTIEYMSPEQVRGQETDARSDIYSLGMLLYEMLTGRVPFTHNSEYELMRSQIEEAPTPPRDFVPDIPLPVEEAIMRSLAKKAEARFQSAGEFRKALLTAIPAISTSQLGVAAPPVPYQGSQFGQTIEGIVSAPGQPSRETTPMVNQPFSANTADHFSTPAGSRQAPAFPAATLQKETRISLTGSSPGETRVAPMGAPVPGAAADVAVAGYSHVAVPTQPVAPPSSGKLNWKHFTAAAAIVFLGLVASAVVLILVIRRPGLADKKAPGSPSQDAQQQPIAQPPGGQITQPDPGSQVLPGPDTPIPDKGKRADRGAGTPVEAPKPGTDTATAQPTTAVPAPSAETQKPKETRVQNPAGPREKPSDPKSASADDNKEKKGKLGGLFKKIGGILKGDDKDKKQQQQH
jgi:serine/threonine-protein kinase